MEAILTIKFNKILGFKIKEELIDEKLLESTNKTLTILCAELKKYFKTQKIKTSITYEIKNN